MRTPGEVCASLKCKVSGGQGCELVGRKTSKFGERTMIVRSDGHIVVKLQSLRPSRTMHTRTSNFLCTSRVLLVWWGEMRWGLRRKQSWVRCFPRLPRKEFDSMSTGGDVMSMERYQFEREKAAANACGFRNDTVCIWNIGYLES